MNRNTSKKTHRGPGKKRKRSRSRSLTPKSTPSPSPEPAEAKTKPRTESEAVPEAQLKSEPKIEREPEPDPESVVGIKVEDESDSNNGEAIAVPEPKTEAKPKLDPETESEAEPKAEPDIEPGSEPDPESVVESNLEDKSDSKRMEGDMKNMGTSEMKKAVYLFFDNTCVPYNHTLYAVDLPNNLNDGSLDSGSIKLSPVLAFESDKYPDQMSCVEVEGKLYFVGGNRTYLPRDVYIFDPLTASLNKPLTEGPEMNTGKCDPLAFVVGKDIYVLSSGKLPTMSMFEVLRADASGCYAKWEILKDPPFNAIFIYGHVVIGNKLFISDAYMHRCYDTVSGQWSNVFNPSFTLWYKALFVDNHVYTCPSPNVVLSHNFLDTKEYLDASLWSVNLYHESTILKQPLPSLAYIGGGNFCYVLSGPRGDLTFPDLELIESHFLGLTIFKASKETYSDDNNEKCFRSHSLHSMHFAVDNLNPCIFFFKDSFILPSCGIEQNLDKVVPEDRKRMIFSRIPICKELELQLGLSQS